MINFRDEEQPHFLYMHFKATDGTPFYVGIGKKRIRDGKSTSLKSVYERAFAKHGRNAFWKAVVGKHGFTVEIVLDNLTFEEALQKEIEFINLYKRRDTDGGLLVNLSSGGDSRNGVKVSPEQLEKMRKASTITFEEQLSRSIAYEPNTGCWIWIGTCNQGYPKMHWDKKSKQANRAIFEVFKGIKVPIGDILVNTCGIKDCVNPDHLVVKRINSKLSSSDVLDIKDLLSQGVPRIDIAKKFNVSRDAINVISTGVNWKHV